MQLLKNAHDWQLNVFLTLFCKLLKDYIAQKANGASAATMVSSIKSSFIFLLDMIIHSEGNTEILKNKIFLLYNTQHSPQNDNLDNFFKSWATIRNNIGKSPGESFINSLLNNQEITQLMEQFKSPSYDDIKNAIKDLPKFQSLDHLQGDAEQEEDAVQEDAVVISSEKFRKRKSAADERAQSKRTSRGRSFSSTTVTEISASSSRGRKRKTDDDDDAQYKRRKIQHKYDVSDGDCEVQKAELVQNLQLKIESIKAQLGGIQKSKEQQQIKFSKKMEGLQGQLDGVNEKLQNMKKKLNEKWNAKEQQLQQQQK